MRQAAAFLTALLVFVGMFLLVERTSSPFFQQCISDESGDKNEHNAKKGNSRVNPVVTAYVRCTGRFVDGHGVGITAIASVIIAAFTATLWAATHQQGKLTFEALKLARDEFISTHRPKLIVRQFQLDALKPDVAIKSRFSVINVGNTEGTVRFIAAEMALWNGKYWEAPGIDTTVKLFGPKPMRNGERETVTVESNFKITEAQIKAVEQNSLIICAAGEFTYTDQLGTERRTGFRRNYDISTDTFITSPNEDQEYQD